MLRHFHQHTFVFNETFDELVDRGQWCRPHWFYKVEFMESDEDESIVAIRWRIDDTKRQGQRFYKNGIFPNTAEY